MRKLQKLEVHFVKAIPEKLESGIIYASIEYATVAHLCCCGCGREVVTPITPTDWKLTYDGETLSLHPSIGNWSFPCRSHYWIGNGRVRWAEDWSSAQIQAGRDRDRRTKVHRFGRVNARSQDDQSQVKEKSIWARIKRIWHR